MDLTVTVNKAELIERITANRDNHRSVFEAALEGFRTQVIEQLEERLDRIRRGKQIDMAIRLPQPEDHTDDYDRVLDMLGMHQGEILAISQDEFAMYVRDDWGWKRQFIASASNYTQVG